MEFEARVLGTQGDYSLIGWEGRRWPGLTIQGDTLRTLVEALTEAESELAGGNIEDAVYAIRESLEKVSGMSAAYEEMMSAAGWRLPYTK
ncbi:MULTISPECIES: hypothetical protein [unclassified Nocardia]|uniref:DUF6959 family protein n=1 Tax=unclassified Nocardia TaxID=2637762 RepID=UPI0024A9E041|nr:MULTISPECIES: hypothetical protein [unclassified Nocardia]